MQYVTLGSSGLKVSRLCLGMMSYGSPAWREWVLSEEQGRPFVKRALERGINFFDTADMYSLGVSEEVLGRAVRDFTRRDQVVIATKAFYPMGSGPNDRGLSRTHLFDAIDASLGRLGTDYVDLYQIHRWDPETPIEETLQALDDIVRAGKARYIGASSMYAWQFARALALADRCGWTRFVSMQNHYNLVYREEEREMLPLCRAEGIGVIPWSPLARGFLAGNRTREDIRSSGSSRASESSRSSGAGGSSGASVSASATPRAKSDDFAHKMYYADADFQIVERVKKVASDRGVAPAQIALAWVVSRPGVTAPIVGATRMEQLDQAVAALDIVLGEEECRYVEELYQPHPVLGHR